LQRGVLKKLALQYMQVLADRHALDCLNRFAFGLDTENQTRTGQAPINRDAAGAAIAGSAAFFGAGQVQLIAQHIQKRLPRVAKKLHAVAVYRSCYVMLSH